LEDIEKIQIVTELVSHHSGQLRLSGQFSRKYCMDFNFDQFKVFSDRESKFTHSKEKDKYFISHWNSSDNVDPTFINNSLIENPQHLHDEQTDLVHNDIELLRILKSRENEILDLKNQLRSIAKLVEVREDNTVGMKFMQTEESRAKDLLLDPPQSVRFIFKYLPKRFQFILRRVRRRTLER
jgi:hypothetical protein